MKKEQTWATGKTQEGLTGLRRVAWAHSSETTGPPNLTQAPLNSGLSTCPAFKPLILSRQGILGWGVSHSEVSPKVA